MVRVFTLTSEIKLMVSYVLLRKLFSQCSHFLMIMHPEYFFTISFCSCFVYGSCIWGISEKMWNVDRYGLRLICIWFVYRTQKSKINLLYPMFSWENYFHEVHIFFSWRNYFGENFRLFDFVRVSCMVRVSVKNLNTLKTSEDLPRQSLQPCFGLIVCMSVMSLKTLKTFINYMLCR